MKRKQLLLRLIPSILIGIMIIVFAIINKQPFYKTLPTLITLVVQFLLVGTNRYAFIIGGFNACLYGISFIIDGVYFSAISSICMSFPVQIMTFFTWKKHRNDSKDLSTKFRRLTVKDWIINLLLMAAGVAGCYFGLAPFFKDATSPLIDATCFVIGIFVSVWVALRYIEAQYMNIVCCALNLVLFTFVVIKEPSSVNFLIITIYNTYMVTMTAINWTLEYRKQKGKVLEKAKS